MNSSTTNTSQYSQLPFSNKPQVSKKETLNKYYKLHSKIYDLTRWSFLFGRKKLLQKLPFKAQDHFSILEVGCGTGSNLLHMCKLYPNASVHGIDLSKHMLGVARKKLKPFGDRVTLIEDMFAPGHILSQTFDVIYFSYSLTVIQPDWQAFVLHLKNQVKPGGFVAIVDFHQTRYEWFYEHMTRFHVSIDPHLLGQLNEDFKCLHQELGSMYFGLWSYFLFIGQK